MLLFACHFTNASAQAVQGGRFIGYNYLGGKEAALKEEEKKRKVEEDIAASNTN